MESRSDKAFVKYNDLLDVIVITDGSQMSAVFNAFKRGTESVVRQYPMDGIVLAFELVPAKSSISGNVWISVILELTEPTYYLWNYLASPNKSTLEEVSKIELGNYHFSSIVCPPPITVSQKESNPPSYNEPSQLSLKLYLVSPDIIYELHIPASSTSKYRLETISDIHNPYVVFDAVGNKIIVPTEKGYSLKDTENGESQEVCGKDVSFVKLSKDCKIAAFSSQNVVYALLRGCRLEL